MYRRSMLAFAFLNTTAICACAAHAPEETDLAEGALNEARCELTVHGEYVIPQSMEGSPGFRGAHPHFTAPSHLFAQGSDVYALHFTQYDDFEDDRDNDEADTFVSSTFAALQKASTGAVLYDEASGGMFDDVASFDAAGAHYIVQRPKSEKAPNLIDAITRQARSTRPLDIGGYPVVFQRGGTTYVADTSEHVEDRHVRTVDPMSGRVIAEHEAPSSERPLSVGHFAASGNDYVVYATRDGQVVTADAMTGRVLTKVAAVGDGEERPVAFTSASTTYVTACFRDDRWTHVVTVDALAGRKISSLKIEDSVTTAPIVVDDHGKPRVLIRGYYKYHVVAPLDGTELASYATRAQDDEPIVPLVRNGRTYVVDGIIEKDEQTYEVAMRDALTGAWQGVTPPAQPRPFAGTNITMLERPGRTWFAFQLGDGQFRANSVKIASCAR